jgi:hypothetical protein
MPQHWKWVAANAPSGAGVNLFQWIARGETGTNGYVFRDGELLSIISADVEATYDDDMTNRALHAQLHDERGGTTELEMQRFAHVPLPVGRSVVLNEAGCHVKIDGEAGTGQFEGQWPAAYVEHLLSAGPS